MTHNRTFCVRPAPWTFAKGSPLHKAGVVAINAIHLDRMPAFDYDKLLWGERQIRSVANSTRADARDFLKLAQEIGIHPRVALFPLSEASAAIEAVRNATADGSVVIVLRSSVQASAWNLSNRQ